MFVSTWGAFHRACCPQKPSQSSPVKHQNHYQNKCPSFVTSGCLRHSLLPSRADRHVESCSPATLFVCHHSFWFSSSLYPTSQFLFLLHFPLILLQQGSSTYNLEYPSLFMLQPVLKNKFKTSHHARTPRVYI